MQLSKYVGLKNDFIIMTAADIKESGYEFNLQTLSEIAQKMCDRNTGIGADDILVLDDIKNICEGYREFIGKEGADCLMYLVNPDGSVAEMTGNGSRCFALFAREKGYGNTDKNGNYTLTISTLAGQKTITYNVNVKDGEYFGKTDMGLIHFDPECMPVNGDTSDLKVEVLGVQRTSYGANSGIPHWVIPLESLDELNAQRLEIEGNALRYDERFPVNTNVNFIVIESRTKIYGRTFERGVGETLACGTGITAMVATLNRHGLVDNNCEVVARGGVAKVEMVPFRDNPKHKEAFLYGPMNKIADIDFII